MLDRGVDGFLYASMSTRHRLTGIHEAFAESGAPIAGYVDSLWWPEPAYEAVRRFLATGVTVTGLLCLNDRIAFGAYQAVQDAGLRIPQDISMVAFDDSDLASWLRPQLTSVALPHFELGRRAVELLLDPDGATGRHLVPMPVGRGIPARRDTRLTLRVPGGGHRRVDDIRHSRFPTSRAGLDLRRAWPARYRRWNSGPVIIRPRSSPA